MLRFHFYLPNPSEQYSLGSSISYFLLIFKRFCIGFIRCDTLYNCIYIFSAKIKTLHEIFFILNLSHCGSGRCGKISVGILLLFNNYLPPVISFLVIFSFHKFFSLLSCYLVGIGASKNRVSRLFEKVKSAIWAILFTCFEKAVELPKMNFLSGFLNLLRILVFSALFFGCLFASQSPPLSSESVVGYTYKSQSYGGWIKL